MKASLWEGVKGVRIAEKWDVTSPTITRIKSGEMYENIPWPDGSKGGLSRAREKALREFNIAPASADTFLDERRQEAQKEGHAVDGRTPLEDQMHQALAALGLSFETIERERIEEEEGQLIAALNHPHELAPGEKAQLKPQQFPVTAPIYETFSWSDVMSLAPGAPLVLEADEEDDKRLQKALGIALKMLPPDSWHGPALEVIVQGLLLQFPEDQPSADPEEGTKQYES